MPSLALLDSRAISTEQRAPRTTALATLPSRKRATKPCPCEPTTIKSAPHVSGQRDIETASQAAEALRRLAGDAAYLLFTIGLVGTGMLGVPVLTGSAAYAVAEAMHWRGSLNDRPRAAPKFYIVLAVAVLLGLALDYVGLNAVRMLFWAAVVNGLLAPPLLVLIVLLTSNRTVTGERVNPPVVRLLGWATAAIMALSGVAMIVMSLMCLCRVY